MVSAAIPFGLRDDGLAASSQWRPGLPAALHSEIFASGDEAGGAALAAALALDGVRGTPRPILWVQDKASIRLTGRPYRPGLPQDLRARVIHVVAKTPEDALFALEEGLRCRDLACVIGEIVGNPKALGLTASRRLSLAAEKHGIPLFLVRLDAERDLSSARMRWDVRSAVSLSQRWDSEAPGNASWRAELFRSRTHRQGEWILRDDGYSLTASPPHHGDLAAAPGDRSLAAF